MKKSSIMILLAIAMFFSSCVKNLEEYGFTDSTMLKGRVIEETEQVPIAGINVSITNGSRTYSSCTTGEDGLFVLEVSFNEIDAEYYLLLSGKDKTKRYDLMGMGREMYDYRDVALYAAITLANFEYKGIIYDVYPMDINNKTWYEAQEFCAELLYADYDNWSLPSKDELIAMYENRGIIGGFSSDRYWSGTNLTGAGSYFYYVDFSTGSLSNSIYTAQYSFRPIRISTSGTVVTGASMVTTNYVN